MGGVFFCMLLFCCFGYEYMTTSLLSCYRVLLLVLVCAAVFWPAVCVWFFSCWGDFLVLVFPSLRGVAGCFSVVLAVPVWRTFLYFCFGRELLCVSHNLEENKILMFQIKNVKAYCSCT